MVTRYLESFHSRLASLPIDPHAMVLSHAVLLVPVYGHLGPVDELPALMKTGQYSPVIVVARIFRASASLQGYPSQCSRAPTDRGSHHGYRLGAL
jgi:hypothetical protein